MIQLAYRLEYLRDGSGFFEVGEAGENLGARKLVYCGSGGLWYLADADSLATLPVVGITMEAIRVGITGRILLQGYIGDSSWSWTLGGAVYASQTAGELTQTEPAGAQIQSVGIATKGDLILFDTSFKRDFLDMIDDILGDISDIQGDITDLDDRVDDLEANALILNANNWEDLRFPANAIRLGGAAPAVAQAYKDSEVLAFANNADKYVYLTCQMPHSWVEGTDIVAHLHWTIPVSGSAGVNPENVKWDLTYSWANTNALFPASTPITFTKDVKAVAADTHIYSEWVDIAGAGKTFSSMLLLSIKRDTSVANNYANAAYLTEFDIHFKQNRLGTLAESP